MRLPDLSNEQIADLLTIATISGDNVAAELFQISPHFVALFRKEIALGNLPQAQKLYIKQLEEKVTDWKIQANIATQRGFTWAENAFSKLDPSDPDAVKAGALLLKSMAEISTAKIILDERTKTQEKTAKTNALKMVK
jgi:hypothetical protein